MRASCPLVSSGGTAIQFIKTACGFAVWSGIPCAKLEGLAALGGTTPGTVCPLRSKHPGDWGQHSLFLCSPIRNSQESYIEGTRAYILKEKASLLWMSAPQYLWAWAIARTDQRLSRVTQEAQARPLGAG